jgi:hypothetical protein
MMKELRHSVDMVFDENADSAATAEFSRPAGAGRG